MLLSACKTQRADLRIEPWTSIAAAIIIVDHLFQSRQTSVVHMGAVRAISRERGCLEVALTCPEIRETAVTPRNARVMQPLVGEGGTGMAGSAVGLAA